AQRSRAFISFMAIFATFATWVGMWETTCHAAVSLSQMHLSAALGGRVHSSCNDHPFIAPPSWLGPPRGACTTEGARATSATSGDSGSIETARTLCGLLGRTPSRLVATLIDHRV